MNPPAPFRPTRGGRAVPASNVQVELGWPGVLLYCATLACSALCVIVPFVLITRSPELSRAATKGSPLYLRFTTVVLVIWAASSLSVQGAMNSGVSAIFGLILGYVFGAQNRRPAELPDPPPPDGPY